MNYGALELENDNFIRPVSFCPHTKPICMTCECVEEQTDFEWLLGRSAGNVNLDPNKRSVLFNPHTSTRTSIISGTSPLLPGYQHYWEMKMIYKIYGTDFMVGIGTADFDLASGSSVYCSLLGRNNQSWGYSYHGRIHYCGETISYGDKWGKGCIVGIHLDSHLGTLEFFVNRKSLGIAYRGIPKVDLYPMICSTSSGSGLKLVSCFSYKTDLQFMSCRTFIRNSFKIPLKPHDLPFPVGMQNIIFKKYEAYFNMMAPVSDNTTGRLNTIFKKKSWGNYVP